MPPEPIAPGLWTDGAAPALIGGRARDSGRIVFPCPPDRDRFESVELPREGRVWSWTVQRFAPKSPPYAGLEPFEPFALGYVELGDSVIVETRLAGAPLDGWRVGQPVRLAIVPFGERETYAFKPC